METLSKKATANGQMELPAMPPANGTAGSMESGELRMENGRQTGNAADGGTPEGHSPLSTVNSQLKNAMAAALPAKKNGVIAKVKQAGSLAGLSQGEVGDYLSALKPRVAAALPRHLTADRIIQMAATTIQRSPAIARCTPASILGAVMQASILGFQPVDALGYCYFVPYGNSVQFQIGYKGLLDLARRSGLVKSVYAEVVREGDQFDCRLGLEPVLEHVPSFDDSRPLTHAYAVVHYRDGGHNFVVLTRPTSSGCACARPSSAARPAAHGPPTTRPWQRR